MGPYTASEGKALENVLAMLGEEQAKSGLIGNIGRKSHSGSQGQRRHIQGGYGRQQPHTELCGRFEVHPGLP